MAAPDVKQLLALDLPTRLALVEALWDSIVHDATSVRDLAPSAAERELLDERLREDDADPSSAMSWSDARARLRIP